QYIHQIEHIGDQRAMETRLRFVEPVYHVYDYLPKPLPQVFGPAYQRLTDICVNLTRDPCLFFRRHLNPEVGTGWNRKDFELQPELCPQLFRGRVVFLAEESVQLRPYLLDVLRINLEETVDALFKTCLEFAHSRH